MKQTIPTRAGDDPSSSQPHLPVSVNDYSDETQVVPMGWQGDEAPTMPGVPSVLLRDRSISPMPKAQEGYEARKKRRAALFYAVMCVGILLVCALLVVSSLGGLAHLLPKSSTVVGEKTQNSGSASGPLQTSTVAASGSSKIIFVPVGGGTVPPGATATPVTGIAPTSVSAITPTAASSITPTPAVTPTSIPNPPPGGTGVVAPVLDCVISSIGPGFVAYFGYINSGSSVVSLPVGPKNHFLGVPPDEGQPTNFSPGTQTFAVAVRSPGRPVTWVLDGSRVVATANSTPCF
jgi:hypothetical protein